MSQRKLRVAFIVQGEGRGHMTQALALKQVLSDAGHIVCEALVGSSPRREIPAFFREKIGCTVNRFDSPNFVADPNNKGIQITQTVLFNARRLGVYRDSLRGIHQRLTDCKPDLVVNFYEPLGGLYYRFYRPQIPLVCIGHQYMLQHPKYPMPPGHYADKIGFRVFTKLTASGAKKKLALSFYDGKPLPNDNVLVVPPLLRQELFEQTPTEGDHILVYLLNDGYAEEIIKWHHQHPDVKLHCFWDRKNAQEVEQVDETLTLHKLHDLKFLQLMASCKGLVTTAGFESACEALYLGKPQLMVPVQGHFEQMCNARDAAQSGVGIWDDTFNISRLLDYIPKHNTDPSDFRAFVNRAPEIFLREMETAAG